MILSCQNIQKAFVGNEVLKEISFHIEDHEKAAIVGINGAGKSTLLKIIVGEMAADDGQVILGKGKSLGYLSQNAGLSDDNTIYEELLSVKQDLIALEHKYGKPKIHEGCGRRKPGRNHGGIQPAHPPF